MDKQKTAPRADGVVLSAEVLQAVMSGLETLLSQGEDVADALDALGKVERMAAGGPVRVVRA